MRSRIPATIASVVLLFSLAGIASTVLVAPASASTYKIQSRQMLRIRLTKDNPITLCSRSFAATDIVAVLVRVGRHRLPAVNPAATQDVYFADRGTLVETNSPIHAGPICAHALTWNKSEMVTITFADLGSAPVLATLPLPGGHRSSSGS